MWAVTIESMYFPPFADPGTRPVFILIVFVVLGTTSKTIEHGLGDRRAGSAVAAYEYAPW